MARLILHVGTHKTATTMVQDRLSTNRKLLAEHGVIYPKLGRHSGHHALLSDWISLPAGYEVEGGGLAGLEKLAQRYQFTDQTLFLSSEEFSRGGGAGGQVDMAALRRVFSGFAQVCVICLLRPQWQFLQSVYLEIGRSRIPARPPEIVKTAIETGMVDGLWCDYKALYKHLRTGFCSNEISFLGYEQASQAKGGVLGEVFKKAQMQISADRFRPEKKGGSNISPTALPRWAAFTIAGGQSVSPKLQCAVDAAFAIEFGAERQNCVFSRTEVADLSRHFKRKNAYLGARIQAACPDFQLGEMVPDNTAIYREDMGGDFWLRAARRIHYSR